MASLSVDEQVEAITATGVILLGMSHETVQTAIDKCDGDRLALNALRVKWNARHRTACADMDRRAETADAEARAAAAWLKHDGTLEDAARERKQNRERRTPGQRVDDALTSLAAMSTVKSGWKQAEPDLKMVKAPRVFGSRDPGTLGDQGIVDTTPILAGLLYLVEQLELVLDAERRLAPPQDLAKLTGEAKDHIILTRLRGVHADDIARFAPWLGGSRTIRNLRRENGQRPVDGSEPPPAPLRAA